ncbi:hypothetical protein [Tepidibacter formicigenes]|jgi:xanthine dehydrogenase molybdopterin-binding subunit B|uniref:Uncharacterized protein n=1 Tax=Tepidibacter formicigenes DSM 15518 TaxID=1123349 RepID=A0A1M6SSG5_9FIRM|nr:hypothetical protein [Tepidibacter formicigenes]SHK47528.1 hypothetical protein SAMN02744037_02417 [Tepidibacter formicigenes DSM 15518]
MIDNKTLQAEIKYIKSKLEELYSSKSIIYKTFDESCDILQAYQYSDNADSLASYYLKQIDKIFSQLEKDLSSNDYSQFKEQIPNFNSFIKIMKKQCILL